MSRIGGYAAGALLPALLIVSSGCSPSEEKGPAGLLSVRVSQTGRAPAAIASASVTIAGIEARRSDGSWVVIDADRAADSIAEGPYGALSIRISSVRLTTAGGGTLAMEAPGNGWIVRLPVDFTVVAGQETVVSLALQLDRSFRSSHGEVEFDPEIAVAGLRRFR